MTRSSVGQASGQQEGFNILISSAGRRVGLVRSFRDVLDKLGLRGDVMAADMSPLSSAFHSADRAFIVPPSRSPDFIPAVQEICRAWSIRLIVPTIDDELPAYARHRARFAGSHTTVAVSSPQTIEIGQDKEMTHDWLLRNGFPTVQQAPIEKVLADPDPWPFPLLVKPREGSSSKGVAVVEDRAHLEAAARGDVVVQTIAKGAEYTIDLFADARGKCIGAVPRRRIEVRAGEVSKGVTVRCSPLEELSRRLCETLPGPYGALTAQAFVDDATGEINVIEINPRFAGGFPLSWEAGANYPRWMIEEILGLPSSVTYTWREDLVMLRYDEAVFVDAAEAGL
jgi:carbamoyl-phosphate synthase large subunit